MSIHDDIQYRVGEGRLIPLPEFTPVPRVRSVYLAAEIIERARNAPDKFARRASAAIWAVLEDFVAGLEFVVRFPSSTNVEVPLALLSPRRNEAWAFRIRFPNPAIRVFGRFAAKDVFIATTWSYRADLDVPRTRGGKKLPKKEENFIIEKKWRDLGIERCKTDWTNLFPNHQPLTGQEVHEYLSNARLAP